MVSTLLLIHLNKGSRKRKDLHPGLPSGRKKTLSDFFYFLISCIVHVVVWVNLVLMLYLFVCLFCFVLIFFNKKNWKKTKTMCVCVYCYLCTLDGLWNKVSQLCITYNLDEHLHALLSNLSFVALLCYFFWFGWSYLSQLKSLFLTGMTRKS